MKQKIKNIYFWFGLIGVIFGSAGINFETLTSWKLLFEAILSILENPVALTWAILGAIGVFVDNSTPGFKDGGRNE
jgi:phi LC3 family holin